eukprot:6550635-Pyramimonas_sp.AAC.2
MKDSYSSSEEGDPGPGWSTGHKAPRWAAWRTSLPRLRRPHMCPYRPHGPCTGCGTGRSWCASPRPVVALSVHITTLIVRTALTAGAAPDASS